MAVLFCATTPAGVMIGVGVSESYEPDSVRSKWVRGICNGITGAGYGSALPEVLNCRRPFVIV